ncbi:peptidyl-prolyl cis-trans isomerase [Solidesulfovibrio sp. C21]|uniref:peptidyl-prolyl cis-trans isomerase n=1 Tax=Solidesulfovibrio sp. C21 TaxID=3398613 RepID=UPI0039FD002B
MRAAALSPRGLVLCLLAVFVLPALGGCGRDVAREPGVVAVVAGSPIRLADVEARHDLGEIGLPEVDNPPVETLRAAYGKVLADMIVARLIRQELARRHQSVTASELDAAEKRVRADYPGDSFERMLLEERIDLAHWRAMLADRLALEKFTHEVLRPQARVEVTKAADYYKEHIDAFTIPPRVRLARVQGRDSAAVKAALAAYRRSGLKMESLAGFAGITTQEAVLPEKNLPASWREALKDLKDGEPSAILTSGGASFFCILQKRLPATVIDPAKAYARVEAILAGRQTARAFAAWLAETLRTTKISINKELLAAMSPGQDTVAAADARDEAGLAREDATVRSDLAQRARGALPAEARSESRPEPARTAIAAGAQSAASAQKEPPQAPAARAPEPAPPTSQTGASASTTPAEPPKQDATGETPTKSEQAAPAGPDASEPAQTAAAPSVPSDAAKEAQPAPAAPAAVADAAPSPQPDTAKAAPSDTRPASPSRPAGGGAVRFMAIKASWIRYSVDEGEEKRVYLKPGKPYEITYTKKLVVRLGSPSELRYSHAGREQTVAVGNKENRSLEFP